MHHGLTTLTRSGPVSEYQDEHTMANDLTFSITTTRFDEHYMPSADSRITTNFANLARGPERQQNLRNALGMIDRRFNSLAHWDNPSGNRYRVELDIVTATLYFEAAGTPQAFPLIEVLQIHIIDRIQGKRYPGIVGNNLSSYVRDYDFSVRLTALRTAAADAALPDDFGELHGKLFQHWLDSDAYQSRFALPPVICISVSTSKLYHRTANTHPVLGVEYVQPEPSLTDAYFAKMGLQVRYFMPPGSVAPLAFYFRGDLLNDYTHLQLLGTISTMETFQKIYRPEIYNANSAAAEVYRPTLDASDFSRTHIDYDRVERSECAVTQGRYTEAHLITPHGKLLAEWAAARPTPVTSLSPLVEAPEVAYA